MIRELVVSVVIGSSVAGAANPFIDEVGAPTGFAHGQARSGPRQPRPTRGPKQDELRLALERALEPAEEVELTARAVGCTLVLTDRRLLLVREGASYRPSSGIRAWPLDRELLLRLGRAHRQTHRLVIERAPDTASVFLSSEQLPDAKALIDRARQRTFSEDEGEDS
jgi:hypothetical protein